MEGQTENFTPRGQTHPWGSKFAPWGEVKNGPQHIQNGSHSGRSNYVAYDYAVQYVKNCRLQVSGKLLAIIAGANPTIFEFTATYNASIVVG
jgi:hypothetical protein